ncbi:MAG: CinA family protein [Selenomonadaceae bacterium]|nr:CinA family protein [Selenomonadaceae bacterium]
MRNEISKQVGDLLKQKNFTVATAESCTGGLLASTLTDVDGASAYVKGGIVSYTNEIKNSVLHVNAETSKNFGVVSAETAREMAANVREIFSSTIGISTTGIAGKSVEDKPVGTVFVAVDAENFSAVKEFHFNGTRTEIKAQAVDAALKLLAEHLT